MASRLMHIAVCSQLEKVLDIKDLNRFRVGQILPDAILSKNKADFNTHFTKTYDNNSRKIMDFSDFFEKYKEKIKNDDLYLGYYFHLIEDDIFRVILYYDVGMLSKRGNPDFMQMLYKDYHILNNYLVKKYSLKNDLYEPDNFDIEKINEIAPFEVADFIKAMDVDFNEKISGEKTIHFTEYFADTFIKKCTSVCVDEYNALLNETHAVSPYDYSWENTTN